MGLGRLRWGVLTGAAAATALLGACSEASEEDETTRDSSGEVVEGGDVGAFRLRVGDCLVDTPSGTFEQASVVPCDEPHAVEVYGAFDLPGDGDAPYPGQEAVTRDAEDGCRTRFRDFVGIPYARSQYGFTSATPTEDSWDMIDDREVLCLLGMPDGTPVTGTLEGARA